jgi:FMN phosphatase YigB (HAD superfamily)
MTSPPRAAALAPDPALGAVRAVLFDVGRTLYIGKGRRHVAAAYTRAACDALGIPHDALSDAHITAAYLAATASVRARHAHTYFRKGGPGPDRTLWLEHNAEVCQRLGLTHPDLPAAIERQWEGWAPALCPQPDCLDTLRGLQAKGYMLGVQSNTFRDHRPRFDADGLTPFFQACALSHETGLWKPDLAAFTDACARLGVAPREALYVGDKWEIDVLPARRAGLLAAFFEAPDVLPDEVPLGVWVIHRLSALLDLLPGR